MPSLSEPVCACGCGYVIEPHHPDPDFRFKHCGDLWRESLAHPEPEAWRAEQRERSRLLCNVETWKLVGFWEELTDERIAHYVGSRNDHPDFDDAVAELTQAWVDQQRAYLFPGKDLPSPPVVMAHSEWPARITPVGHGTHRMTLVGDRYIFEEIVSA